MPAGRKRTPKAHEPSTEDEGIDFGGMTSAVPNNKGGMMLTGDQQELMSFYSPPVLQHDEANIGNTSANEITKSGRMRKKTAKLIEMEEVDKLEKIPRKSESSKARKPKAPKTLDRASAAASALDSSNLSDDSGDLPPLVIAKVFSLASPGKCGFEPQSSSVSNLIETPVSKSKKAKSNKDKSTARQNDRALRTSLLGELEQRGIISTVNAGVISTVNVNANVNTEPTGFTTVQLSGATGMTPKKTSKKKVASSSFPIKMEDHAVASSSAQQVFAMSEMSLPFSSPFSKELLNSGYAVKEEMDSDNVGNDGNAGQTTSGRKEKTKKKDYHKIDLTGSGDELNSISETKTSKKKLKLGNGRKELEKPKKKRQKGYTAYMLWCSVQRAKVVAQNPGIDFVQISKRLGDMWQTVPEKEKMTLRRKARRMAKKGSSLIKTGAKDELSSVDAGHRKMLYNMKPLKLKIQPVEDPLTKVTNSVDNVDVAAHLKLLGESLTTIGVRLQEHRGNIAVQGSLSVLLDSLLCTLGPLMCLTNQVPQLNGCPEEIHRNTLENIAYIMPGVG